MRWRARYQEMLEEVHAEGDCHWELLEYAVTEIVRIGVENLSTIRIGEVMRLPSPRSINRYRCRWGRALPVELIDGQWGRFERSGPVSAMITYTVEPVPETGHVGWIWWADGRMGDAPSLRKAMQAAEAALAKESGK